MTLLILCVDGIDYDYAKSLDYPKLPYEKKIEIQDELCNEDGWPLTALVWPTIFTETLIDELLPLHIHPLRYRARKLLHSMGIQWERKNRARSVNVTPKMSISTFLDRYNSFDWNIPRISLQFATHFADTERYLEWSKEEYRVWKIILMGLTHYKYDVAACYCRIIDAYGHHYKPLDDLYMDVDDLVKRFSKTNKTILVSDHGCIDGKHTKHAYYGSTEPIKAQNVLDIGQDIHNILGQEDGNIGGRME